MWRNLRMPEGMKYVPPETHEEAEIKAEETGIFPEARAFAESVDEAISDSKGKITGTKYGHAAATLRWGLMVGSSENLSHARQREMFIAGARQLVEEFGGPEILYKMVNELRAPLTERDIEEILDPQSKSQQRLLTPRDFK